MNLFLNFAIHVALLAFPTIQAESSQPQSHDKCPLHKQHRLDEVNRRGDHQMGFSHEKTTHRFRLYEDGGAIEVNANNAADAESREQIQKHLAHIAQMFSEGNFSTPKAVHNEEPPGTSAMVRLRSDISYKYETTERGGRVRITASAKEALNAVHEFLRYQIRDHHTGDSLEIEKRN